MRLRALTATATATVAALLLAACSTSAGGRAAGPASSGTPRSGPSAAASPSGGGASAGSPSPGATPAYYRQRLAWRACGDGFECATLKVPLDYARADSELIDVAVIRLPASGKRRGSVVLNPGGPGGSGVDYARAARSVVTDRLRKAFDVVGFDPRGVGESTPVRCLTPAQLDAFVALDPTPDSPAERDRVVAGAKAFGAGCEARSPSLLPHVGTIDAARDMDVLRAALGDDKLTYIGKSYGTFLGALYANLFPQRVRALVLDGAIDPTLTGEQLNETQAKGFEVALDAFIADCVGRGGCPLGTTAAAADQAVTDLIARADRSPLPASSAPGADGRMVNEAEAVLGIATALYSTSTWGTLRTAFSRALRDNDGSVLLQLADALVDRRPDGTYSNQTESNTAINCVDRPEPTDPAVYARDAEQYAARYPHFGALIAYGTLPCAFWPVPPVTTPMPLRATGSAPILVIGNTRDPATPLVWAQGLARQLDAGVLLTYDGDGHTIYGKSSSCVNRIVDDYLVDLTVPTDGARC